MLRRLLIVALIASWGLAASGCASVAAWERGRLAHSCMKLTDRMGDRYVAHVLSIREGSIGGEGAAGGGCGCN